MDFINEKRKSRDLDFYDFFILLQKEYIVAELRKKIYPDSSGRDKSKEIMAGKREKILDMAIKNNLKTIFDDAIFDDKKLYDEELKLKLHKEIYGNGGLPNFIYRDDTHKKNLGKKDERCYFSLNSKFNTPSGVGVLQFVDFKKNESIIKMETGKVEYYNTNLIQRIL